MFYNYQYAIHFILLCVAFVATLNGLMILKTHSTEPVGALQTTLTGSAAVWRGAALVTLGAVSFLAFLWLLLV
jgi:hypothetical protein